jgi:alpha-ketoglutarate-dependent taurine dioxygenase
MSQMSSAPQGIRRRTRGQATVDVDEFWRGQTLPAMVRASAPGIDLSGWIKDNQGLVDGLLLGTGAVVFRGFEIRDAAGFHRAMDAMSSQVLAYGERSSPRSEVIPGVYTSTDHPQDQPIILHNEQSYTLNWPMRIAFYCDQEPTSGGRTPLADSRRVLARLSPALVQKFAELEVCYRRNYLPGIGLSWPEAFGTQSRDEVEKYCRGVDISVEWVDENHLRTSQVRPAIRVHPRNGERTWFNHALFFNATSLPEDIGTELRRSLPEEDFPYQTFYGDGTSIEPETLDELRAAYAAETTAFDWRQGDVLAVENMLVAHAREPFEGPRRILASMTDPFASVKEQS